MCLDTCAFPTASTFLNSRGNHLIAPLSPPSSNLLPSPWVETSLLTLPRSYTHEKKMSHLSSPVHPRSLLHVPSCFHSISSQDPSVLRTPCVPHASPTHCSQPFVHLSFLTSRGSLPWTVPSVCRHQAHALQCLPVKTETSSTNQRSPQTPKEVLHLPHLTLIFP